LRKTGAAPGLGALGREEKIERLMACFIGHAAARVAHVDGEIVAPCFPTDLGAAEAQRGIGLTQAKDAVRRAGGVATIESMVGQGSTVTLAIPLATA